MKRKAQKSLNEAIKAQKNSFVVCWILQLIGIIVDFILYLAIPGFSFRWALFVFVIITRTCFGIFPLPQTINESESKVFTFFSYIETLLEPLVIIFWIFDARPAFFATGLIVIGYLGYYLAFSFLTKNSSNYLLDIPILKHTQSLAFFFGCVAFFSFSILLIYNIRDSLAQSLIASFAASIFGGFITLVGILHTINMDKIEEPAPLLIVINKDETSLTDSIIPLKVPGTNTFNEPICIRVVGNRVLALDCIVYSGKNRFELSNISINSDSIVKLIPCANDICSETTISIVGYDYYSKSKSMFEYNVHFDSGNPSIDFPQRIPLDSLINISQLNSVVITRKVNNEN
jgi:hypothetical protein